MVTAGGRDTRLDHFYQPTGYAFAWTLGGKATDQARALIETFQGAEARGLNAEDYDGSLWDGRLAHLPAASDSDLARFDLALTVSALRYVSDLHFGRANPGLFHNLSDPKEEFADLPAFLRQRLVNTTDVKAALEGLEPPYPGYRRTKQALQNYLAMAHEGSLPLLRITAKTVETGAAYEGAAPLAAILRRLGDLTELPGNLTGYNGPLVDAVKRFQARHGLDPDGRLGKATLAQLNTPLSRHILQLKLSMERWRWVPHSFPRPPIVVNIPEFRLRALDSAHQTDLEMKVVVGSAYGDHKTPVFAANMTYLIFRPYWDVPVSIAKKELALKLEKDRTYLAKNKYEVVNADSQVVSEGTVDDATLAEIRTGKLRVRQVPGPENALGLIKFLLPNEHDVYLHDTPATELFSKTRRDFSHGCIRLEKPEDLAAWVLRDKPEWTPERIHDAMNGDETLRVDLGAPIPVLIVYTTAVVMASGEVRFFDDIYKQDAQLELALAGGHRMDTRR
jgi:murein L,D-transpeptidase YcbB/YkuD